MTVSFVIQERLSFLRSHLLIVDFSVCAFNNGILFRKSFPVAMSSRLFPVFSSVGFHVSAFMWKSLVHLKSSFVQGHKYLYICIPLHTFTQFDQHCLLTMLSLFQSVFLTSISKIKCP